MEMAYSDSSIDLVYRQTKIPVELRSRVTSNHINRLNTRWRNYTKTSVEVFDKKSYNT